MYLMVLVDWYAQMASDDATQVQSAPATASQKANPMVHGPPRTNGLDCPLQRPSLTALEPHPAGKAIRASVKRSAAKDCREPHAVNTEQHAQLRQHRVSRANRSVITWGGREGGGKLKGRHPTNIR